MVWIEVSTPSASGDDMNPSPWSFDKRRELRRSVPTNESGEYKLEYDLPDGSRYFGLLYFIKRFVHFEVNKSPLY